MHLVTAEEMQAMDRRTIDSYGIPGQVLMENAGRGATRMLMQLYPDIRGKRVAVLAGRGNNGGDGFVMARYLSAYGARTTVYLLGRSEGVKGDAAANLKLLQPIDVDVVELPSQEAFDRHRVDLRHCDLLIDAILGTGLKQDVRGYFRSVIEFVNAAGRPVFSVDIPSGLDSETGQPHGICIRADATATFAFAKTGQLIHPGMEMTGRLGIVDIGIPKHIVEEIGPRQALLTPEVVRGGLFPRKPDAHKGTFGHLLVVAGGRGKTGAAVMTATAAMKAGAGLVTLGVPASIEPIVASRVLELMTEPLADDGAGLFTETVADDILDLAADKACIALGPGIGTADTTKKMVHRLLLESEVPVVVDADGLNNLAGHLEIFKKVAAPVVVTPHPGEMSRLCGWTVKAVQQDRVKCARDFAAAHGITVVLKGAATVVARPNGMVHINSTGNPGMASGGMGDVLTGVIAGLICQGHAPEFASLAGVFLHGAGADHVAETNGSCGFLASQVMNSLPRQLTLLLENREDSGVSRCLPEQLGL